MNLNIAILLPCYNEALTIKKVVSEFKTQLPGVRIYVYDNNSTDDTIKIAKAAGAIVRQEPRQGKGFVVQRMFADIEADVYVMADGDDTYDATCVSSLIEKLYSENLDMVVGTRKASDEGAYRSGHRFGNKLFSRSVAFLFGRSFTDILSGYRVFSRRFVKSFPSMAGGFEIETELTVHALDLKLPVGEVSTPYGVRPEGSESKLSTYKDGLRVLKMLGLLFKEIRPLAFFTVFAGCFGVVSLALALPVLMTYLETGLVPRLPTAMMSMGFGVIAFLCFFSGVLLDSVSRGRRENKRLIYLRYTSVQEAQEPVENAIQRDAKRVRA